MRINCSREWMGYIYICTLETADMNVSPVRPVLNRVQWVRRWTLYRSIYRVCMYMSRLYEVIPIRCVLGMMLNGLVVQGITVKLRSWLRSYFRLKAYGWGCVRWKAPAGKGGFSVLNWHKVYSRNSWNMQFTYRTCFILPFNGVGHLFNHPTIDGLGHIFKFSTIRLCGAIFFNHSVSL